MSAATDHAALLSAVAEMRAVVEAGTPGPWVTNPGTSGWTCIRSVGPNHSTLVGDLESLPNAALIVQSVNSAPAVLALVEAVLSQHTPARILPHADECPLIVTEEHESGEGSFGEELCWDCAPIGWYCEQCVGDDSPLDDHPWPCPLVTLAAAVVGREVR